jgi:hypothetical protein
MRSKRVPPEELRSNEAMVKEAFALKARAIVFGLGSGLSQAEMAMVVGSANLSGSDPDWSPPIG